MIRRNVPLKRKVPVKKISAKQVIRRQEWRATKEQLHDPHDVECEMKVKCNGAVAGTWQHLEGRLGHRLNDITLLKKCCLDCHMWCETHPKEAIALGFAKPRLYGK